MLNCCIIAISYFYFVWILNIFRLKQQYQRDATKQQEEVSFQTSFQITHLPEYFFCFFLFVNVFVNYLNKRQVWKDSDGK